MTIEELKAQLKPLLDAEASAVAAVQAPASTFCSRPVLPSLCLSRQSLSPCTTSTMRIRLGPSAPKRPIRTRLSQQVPFVNPFVCFLGVCCVALLKGLRWGWPSRNGLRLYWRPPSQKRVSLVRVCAQRNDRHKKSTIHLVSFQRVCRHARYWGCFSRNCPTKGTLPCVCGCVWHGKASLAAHGTDRSVVHETIFWCGGGCDRIQWYPC